MLAFADPHKWLLALFLFVVVLDAAVGVINPLLYRDIINDGILKGNATLIVKLAIVVACLGVLDAGFGLTQSYLSATIGFLPAHQTFRPHSADAYRLFHTGSNRGFGQPPGKRRERGSNRVYRYSFERRGQSYYRSPGPSGHVRPLLAHHPGRTHLDSAVRFSRSVLGT